MGTLSENIRQLRVDNGLTQKELARLIGMTPQMISAFEMGIREPKIGTLEKLARVLGVKKTELLGDSYPAASFRAIPATRLVPVLGRISCGNPILAEQNIERMMAVPDQIPCNYILECQGDSMIDAGINDGDMVYVRQQPDVEDGEIAVVLIGNEATLKRVYHHDTFIQLVACNAKYPPLIVTARDETVRIEGKAVAYTHML